MAGVAGDGWLIGGRYRVLERVGVGGMAEVFRAHDEVLGRDVAVKVFRSTVAADDTAARVERRETELRVLAQLNHANLITLYDGELAGHPAYLVMEMIEGSSMADRIRDGALAERACREAGRQIADALAYVHARGMVHRDVKPANILLGDDGRARLSDFGIVRLLDAESLTNADATLGTASYLAPEQMRGSQVGPPADVYALGLTLIEALTGTRSFDGPPLEAAMARLARDPVIPAHVAGPWPRLLAAMTAREPSARPSAEQVAMALRTTAGAPAGLPADAPAGAATVSLAAVAAASTTAMPPVSRPRPAPEAPPVLPVGPPPESRRGVPGGVIAAAAVVLLLLIGGLAAWIISSSTGNDAPSGGGNSSTTAPPSSSRSTSASSSTERSSSSSSRAPSSDSSSRSSSSSSRAPSSSTATSSSAGSSSSSTSSSASTSTSNSTTANQAQAPPPPVTSSSATATSTSPPAP